MGRTKTTQTRRGPSALAGRKAGRRPPRARKLTPANLAHFRALLLAKRRDLLGDMDGLEAEAADGGLGGGSASYSVNSDDPAESGWLCQKSDVTAGLLANEKQILREIDDALLRIASGTYGLCEGTGQPIHKARLEARPWARYCIEYARQLERHGLSASAPSARPDPYSPPVPEDDSADLDEEDDTPLLPVPIDFDMEAEGDEPQDEEEA